MDTQVVSILTDTTSLPACANVLSDKCLCGVRRRSTTCSTIVVEMNVLGAPVSLGRFVSRIVLLMLACFMFYGRSVVAQTCVPPPSGILAWWPFDEKAGPIATELIGGRVGTYFGTPSPTPAPGEVNNALRFNSGSRAFVGVADDDVWAFGLNDFSIELWTSFATPGGGSIGEPSAILIGSDEGPGNRSKWFLGYGGGFLYFHINSPTLGPQFFPLAPFSPKANTFYHIALTRSGSLYSLYINGVLAKSAMNSAGVPNAAAFLTIGEGESIGYMNGLLDEVTIYNRALTGLEVASISTAGSAGKCKWSNGTPLEIQSVSPIAGGNAGQVTVSFKGAGFQPGAVVDLTLGDAAGTQLGMPINLDAGVSAILARGSNTGITSGGLLQTTFDLTGVSAQSGLQVQIINPDGTSAAVPFTVIDGGAPNLQLELVGPATARVGRATQFAALLKNTGTLDAMFAEVSASIIFPNETSILATPVQPLMTGSLTSPIAPSQLLLSTATPPSLDISPIPIGVSIPITLPFTLPEGTLTCGNFQAFLDTPPANNPRDCETLTEEIASIKKRIASLQAQLNQVLGALNSLGCGPTPPYPPKIESECLDLAIEATNLSADIALAQRNLANIQAEFDVLCTESSNSVRPRSRAHTLNTTFAMSTDMSPTASQSVCPVNSWDPNAKVGPSGIGPTDLVSSHLFPYTVFFENLASAGASAEHILVVDPLDPSLDASTVSIGTLNLSGTSYDLGGGQHVSKTIDLRPGTNALLRVQADLDINKRQITWTFDALDSTTLQLPSDPQVGILPPNVTPPQGEGYVTFTASAKQTTPENATISNQATITFDLNPPIQTNVWSNTTAVAPAVTTSLALTANPTASAYGQQVQLIANLTPSSAGTNSTNGESVTFYSSGPSLGTGTLNGGVATLNVSSLPIGTVNLEAVFPGDVNFVASTSNVLTYSVSTIPQTISFTVPTTPVTYGVSAITLTATGGASGNPVVFSVVAGPCSILATAVTIIGVGSCLIAADQAGNATYAAAAEVTRSIIVNPAVTALKIGAFSPTSPVVGNAVAFSATVSSSAGAPPGTVTFSVDGVAQTPVAVTGDFATVNVSGLTQGTHTIGAVFASSNSNFSGAAAPSVPLTVRPAPSSGSASTIILITKATFTKLSDGSYQGTVTVSNNGTATAQNVVLTSAKLGAVAGTPAPQTLGNIPSGSSVVKSISFPAIAGPSGTLVLEQTLGTYTGGTFGGSLRVTLP